MAQTLPALSPPEASRKRWTRDECRRLMQMEILPEGKFELLGGDIILKMSQNRPHVLACMQALEVLAAIFGFAFVQSQAPVAISNFDDPEPDAAVLTRRLNDYPDNPTQDDVRLLVEVSDSTLRTDLGLKALLYGQAGVIEYWVIDVNARTLHVFRQPGADGYASETVLSEDQSVSPLAASDASIKVADLLP